MFGYLIDEIVNFVLELKVDFVVVGYWCCSGLLRWWMGLGNM